MDENNNNIKEPWEQPIKENPFKNWKFYAAYFITIIVLGILSWLLGSGSYIWMIGMLVLCIPYIIVGFIVWAILRSKSRPIALGILFASFTPFVIVFAITGGCGLFVF